MPDNYPDKNKSYPFLKSVFFCPKKLAKFRPKKTLDIRFCFKNREACPRSLNISFSRPNIPHTEKEINERSIQSLVLGGKGISKFIKLAMQKKPLSCLWALMMIFSPFSFLPSKRKSIFFYTQRKFSFLSHISTRIGKV